MIVSDTTTINMIMIVIDDLKLSMIWLIDKSDIIVQFNVTVLKYIFVLLVFKN
jgi:hypothetical protein